MAGAGAALERAARLVELLEAVGKSTVSSILAMHTALYQPGSLTLLLSPTERQSKELFRKVLDVYWATGKTETPRVGSANSIRSTPGYTLATAVYARTP